MAEENRIEGQLWIDRNAPHGLKYHTAGETYQLVPEKVYTISGSIGGASGVSAGSLIAADGTNNYKLAQFPKDIDRVIGICPIDISNGQTKETSLLKSGTVVLPKSAFKQIGSEVSWGSSLKGAPVYWFIGRSSYSNNTHTYIDPSTTDYIGKLTLATPSGMRWEMTTDDFNSLDYSLNVGYSNLPIVGTVVEVGTNDVTVNVNISKFESELEWHWPYFGSSTDKNKPKPVLDPNNSNNVLYHEIVIRHGLFCIPKMNGSSNYYAFRPRCFCDVVALENDKDTENIVLAGVDNFYGLPEYENASDDKRTEITFKGYDGKRIYVSGKVVYTFDKQYD